MTVFSVQVMLWRSLCIPRPIFYDVTDKQSMHKRHFGRVSEKELNWQLRETGDWNRAC
ncbi:MAG: hypothetical protein H8E44_01830 [Planctomycetes bacterium]|nr:hypothetical protein [Planctomycetota bacterium]